MKRSTRILIAIFVMSLLFAGSEELKQVQEGMSLGGIYEKEIQEISKIKRVAIKKNELMRSAVLQTKGRPKCKHVK